MATAAHITSHDDLNALQSGSEVTFRGALYIRNDSGIWEADISGYLMTSQTLWSASHHSGDPITLV